MQILYDTTAVHPLDRYEYYRAGAGSELAPVAVHGRRPGRMFAAMSVAQFGDFVVEEVRWTADSEVVAWRTHRLIRAGDPECYRIIVSVEGGGRAEQADARVRFRPRDVALFDLSLPWQSIHTTGMAAMRTVMVTFPRSVVPIDHAAVRPLMGTVMPRRLPGRGLIAQFLTELADDTAMTDIVSGSALAEVLHECTLGLIRQRLGLPDGITRRTRRLLLLARVQRIIRGRLADPALDPDRIATAANISPRQLHKLFEDGEPTPMQLVKRLRLEQCRRRLEDPATATTPIKDIILEYGYRRADQFARDFRQQFGVSPRQVRGEGR